MKAVFGDGSSSQCFYKYLFANMTREFVLLLRTEFGRPRSVDNLQSQFAGSETSSWVRKIDGFITSKEWRNMVRFSYVICLYGPLFTPLSHFSSRLGESYSLILRLDWDLSTTPSLDLSSA